MTGEKLSSIKLPNMDILYWSFCSSSRKGRDGVKGEGGGGGYLSQLQV